MPPRRHPNGPGGPTAVVPRPPRQPAAPPAALSVEQQCRQLLRAAEGKSEQVKQEAERQCEALKQAAERKRDDESHRAPLHRRGRDPRLLPALGHDRGHPWATTEQVTPQDPRLVALAQREKKLQRRAAEVKRVVDRRWAVYERRSARRQWQNAVALQRHMQQLEASQAAAVRAAQVRPLRRHRPARMRQASSPGRTSSSRSPARRPPWPRRAALLPHDRHRQRRQEQRPGDRDAPAVSAPATPVASPPPAAPAAPASGAGRQPRSAARSRPAAAPAPARPPRLPPHRRCRS